MSNDYVNEETAAQLARWTKDMHTAAEKEGWNMFDYDTMGLLEIERSDEAEVFERDDDAIAFVKERAAAGDPKAALALELEEFFQPIIEQVREANAASTARMFGR